MIDIDKERLAMEIVVMKNNLPESFKTVLSVAELYLGGRLVELATKEEIEEIAIEYFQDSVNPEHIRGLATVLVGKVGKKGEKK